MTISQKTWSILEQSDDREISSAQIAYFRERLRNRVHEAVLKEFLAETARANLTKTILARRLGKRPEQITRWLAAPGNWTLDTVSDLLLAMNSELDPSIVKWSNASRSNYAHPLACRANVEGARSALIDGSKGKEMLRTEGRDKSTDGRRRILNISRVGGSALDQTGKDLPDGASIRRRDEISRASDGVTTAGAAAFAYSDT